MNWNRHISKLEMLLVEILEESNSPMTLQDIVAKIKEKEPSAFSGKTPMKSLYSIIYRREKRRKKRNEKPLLRIIREEHPIRYSLNNTTVESIDSVIIENG